MITVRVAERKDAQKITEFQLSMAAETEDLNLPPDVLKKGVSRVFDDPSKGRYYVAESGGEVIASLMITYEWSDWRNKDVWWFQSVYVIPEFRRKGVFRIMYNHIREQSEKENVAGLRLYVESNNEPALRTYEAMGMTSEHYTMYEWLKP
jgi:ribosomal protein S18 acetylase RimI-like enzyme